jgi:hypothetical protein
MKIEMMSFLNKIIFLKNNVYKMYFKIDKPMSLKQKLILQNNFTNLCNNTYILLNYLKHIDNKYKNVYDYTKINAPQMEKDYQLFIKVKEFFKENSYSVYSHLTIINDEFNTKHNNIFHSSVKENINNIKNLWHSLYGHFEDRSFMERVQSHNSELLKIRDYKFKKAMHKSFYDYFNMKEECNFGNDFIDTEKFELNKEDEIEP